MCGRFTYLTADEIVEVVAAIERARAGEPAGAVRLRANVERGQARPRSDVQAIVTRGQHVDLATFSWGFRPTASTDVVFNTRIESALAGTPLWREPLRDGRCIVPAASFFEPHRSEKSVSFRTGRQIKRQYEFADAAGAPLLLAGIHDGHSVSVLTTEPNAVVRPVHDRMPLVLRFSEVPTWLDGDFVQLADRSGVEFAISPEEVLPTSSDVQLTLF